MSYIIIIYLLGLQGIGTTTQQQLAYRDSYTQHSTISDAHLVQDDPRFPSDYVGQRDQGRDKVELMETY